MLKLKMLRDRSVDTLRGFAVLTMAASHTIFFTYGLHRFFLNQIFDFGNNFSYTTFLFCFGVCFRISSLLQTIKRILKLSLFYYLLGFYTQIYTLVQKPNIFEFYKIIFNYQSRTFTEYLLPFILYTIIFSGLYLIAKKIKIQFNYLVLTSLVISVIGNFLSIHYPNNLLINFYGKPDFYNFPLLQYLPVFVIGLYFSKSNRQNLPIAGFILLLASQLIMISFNWTHQKIKIDFINVFQRWPPSLLFITSTLSNTIGFWIFTKSRYCLSILHAVLGLYGKNSLLFVAYHLVILFIFDSYHLTKLTSPLHVLVFYIGILVSFCLFISILNKVRYIKAISQTNESR